jgi:hypothetical protein
LAEKLSDWQSDLLSISAAAAAVSKKFFLAALNLV